MKRLVCSFPVLLGGLWIMSTELGARDRQPKPIDAFFTRYDIVAAPKTTTLQLQKGDRLAICGDSITEQRQYSVILETYLTACLPELNITVRQYGWSGEQAAGFYARMHNDVLRFQPTIATTCYGMNDHRYVPYTDEIGSVYRDRQTAIVRTFKEAGARVVIGSPGTISTVPHWVKTASGTWEDLNESLCHLRTIGVEIAKSEHVAFADVWWPMMQATFAAQHIGPDFAVSGKDGVHPGWAGQAVMASAFLDGLGVTGDLGTIKIDLTTHAATTSHGHEVKKSHEGSFSLSSSQWIFAPPSGPLDHDDSLRAGMALAHFDERFNRLILQVSGLSEEEADITWGSVTKRFNREQLTRGINLAAAFEETPFTEPFSQLWNAVQAKQEYETRQIKSLIHGPEGKADMEATVALTEKTRAPLAAQIAAQMQPVEHTINVTPVVP